MQDWQQLYWLVQRQSGAQGRQRKYSRQNPGTHCWQVPALVTMRQLSVQTGSGCPHVGRMRREQRIAISRMGILGLILLLPQLIHHQTTFLFLFMLSFLFSSSFFASQPQGLFMGIELTIFSFSHMKSFGFSNYQSMNMVHRTRQGAELWLGDYYAASNVSLLKQKNIRAVLTSAAMLGISYPKEHAISHKTINAFDVPSYKMTPHFEEAFRFIDESLKQGHILVHCAAGISRSTTFVLVYLMRGEGMGLKQAMDYVRAKRSVICPNYGFQNELKRLQVQLKKVGKHESSQLDKKNVSSFTQKKAVLDFLNEDKGKKEEKLSFTTTAGGSKFTPPNFAATVGGNGSNGMSVLNGSTFLRGKSVNYTQKRPQNNPPERGFSNAKQYLSFKLESPKIVTIKK